MAKFLLHVLITLSLLTLKVLSTETITSCSQTPYPQVCTSSLLTSTSQFSLPEIPTSFRDFVLRSTMNRAITAHESALATNLASLDVSAKAAWADCIELAQDTIQLINISMSLSSPNADAQTWLSAAVANQQTCRNGFADLDSSFDLTSAPFMSNNLSESLSNSLAVNKPTSTSGGNRRLLSDGFPIWVSAADRKLLQSSPASKANVVVAKDGSGNYETISEALAAYAKMRSGSSRYIVHVKAGVYKENVEVTKSMKNVMIVGDGIGSTVVTGSKNVQDGSTTFRSATFAVVGSGFIAQDITFENSAGAAKHQAVAFRSGSDLSVCYRCSFKGYQDTLYVYSQRQFYRNCDIYGTVDFIFGDAVAVLQNCNIYVRRPLSNQKNTVTAQGRSDPNENTGISIHNCVVTAASDLKPVQGSFETYLGRPWQKYSRTVVMKTSLGSLIAPAGWSQWSGNFALSTLYYGEYMNTGPGASTSGRVKWPGYHVMMSAAEAGKFTVGKFFSGDSWIPATGVPYTSGL